MVGTLQPGPAAELGIPPGARVVSATGDTMSAAVGSGAVADYAGHLYVGTSSWIQCHVPFKRTDARRAIATLPAALPGRYLVSCEQQTAGASLERLREEWLAGTPEAAEGYAALDALAASAPPGSGRVIFTPWLNGERTPVDDHLVRGGFHNLSLDTTRAQLVRAVLEGVALNARWMLDGVERFVRRPLPELRFIGGGALSDLWCQIFADVLDRRILRVADPVQRQRPRRRLPRRRGPGRAAACRHPRAGAGRRHLRPRRRPAGDLRRAVARAARPVQEDARHLRARSTRRAVSRPPDPERPHDRADRPPGHHRRVPSAAAPADPMAALEAALKPYRGRFPTHDRLPAAGRAAGRGARRAAGDGRGRDAEVAATATSAGAVYQGDPEHVAFLSEAYTLHSQSNPLHLDVWPSAAKFEAEIVAMTARMLGADGAAPDEVVGTVTSGGTESIMLAMKAYRDRAQQRDGIAAPAMVVPETAHAAFDKAAHSFGMRQVKVPVGADERADVAATAAAIDADTCVVVGSAPSLPARAHRPDRGAVGARARARDRLPHRRVPRRLRPAVGRAARRRRPGVRLPAAGRHVDVGRHPQVRLRGEGHERRPVPRRGPAPLPVLHDDRLARRGVRHAVVRRQPRRRPERRVLGRARDDRGGRATSRPRARSSPRQRSSRPACATSPSST